MSKYLISSHLHQLFNAYLPPVAWAGLIFYLSSQSTLPGPSYPWLDYVFKQGAHIFVYAVLHFLIWRAIKISSQPTTNYAQLYWVPILIALTYAFTDEFHQSFTPGRTATIIDIVFDVIGIIGSHYLTHRQKRLHSHQPQNR